MPKRKTGPLKAIPWPNRLGWEVETALGPASVAEACGQIYASVPVAPVQKWLPDPLRGPARWITVTRRRVARFPIGTDPVEAVRICLRRGAIVDDGHYGPPDIPILD